MNRATPEHVNQVLTEVEAVLRDKLGCVNCLTYFLIFALFAGFIGLAVAGSHGAIHPGAIFGGFFGIIVLLIVTACIRKSRVDEARIVCHRILDEHNARIKDAGLRWSLPVHFPMWIELNNDFRIQPGVVIVQPMPVVVNQQPAYVIGQPGFIQTQPQFQQQQFVQTGFAPQDNNMYYPPQQQYQMP
jgi:hypothetical protein